MKLSVRVTLLFLYSIEWLQRPLNSPTSALRFFTRPVTWLYDPEKNPYTGFEHDERAQQILW
jgi:hypothetical protein